LAGIPRRTLLLYCKEGLVRPATDPDYGGLLFEDSAILTIRRAEALRTEYGMELAGVRLVFALLAEVEELREELRFARGY